MSLTLGAVQIYLIRWCDYSGVQPSAATSATHFCGELGSVRSARGSNQCPLKVISVWTVCCVWFCSPWTWYRPRRRPEQLTCANRRATPPARDVTTMTIGGAMTSDTIWTVQLAEDREQRHTLRAPSPELRWPPPFDARTPLRTRLPHEGLNYADTLAAAHIPHAAPQRTGRQREENKKSLRFSTSKPRPLKVRGLVFYVDSRGKAIFFASPSCLSKHDLPSTGVPEPSGPSAGGMGFHRCVVP